MDTRHDPAPPGERSTRRTITLTAVWTDGDVPRSHIWSLVVDPQGVSVGSKETGDALPDR